MAMNFGEISFRKGGQQVVGLPLDVIDKVGTNLTESYHRNRTAASGLIDKTLNIPDSGSDVNKKIISEISTNIKNKFEAFKKEDNWFDAENAVYSAADELSQDSRVKDLTQYNANYTKVNKEIDDSKAPEYYKQIRRMKNQTLNTGIRDKDGKAQQYQGRSISSNLDISEDIKGANDLITGFKADVKEYTSNPEQFNMDNASDGFKLAFTKFTKTRIETVSEDEVRNLVYSSLAANPMYQSKVAELAELDLFNETGKSIADEHDVTSVMLEQAKYSPSLYNEFIVSSPEFATQTKGMLPAKKQEFLSKLQSDESLKNKFLASGVDQFTKDNKARIGNDSLAYNKVYTNFKKQLYLKSFDALIDKASYENVSSVVDYKESSLNSVNYAKWAEDAKAKPMYHDVGMINKESVASHLDTRNLLLKDIDNLEMQLLDSKIPDSRKEFIKQDLATYKARLRGNDTYIDAIVSSTGLTKQDILDKSKEDLMMNISSSLSGIISNTNQDGTTYQFGMNANNMSVEQRISQKNKIYNIFSKNIDTPENIRQELKNDNILIPEGSIQNITNSFNTRLKENTMDIVKNYKGDIKSSKIVGLGYLGKEPANWIAIKEMLANEMINGTGTMVYETSNKGEHIDQTNLGKQYVYKETSGKDKDKYKNWDIAIEPVMYAKDSPNASNLSSFQVILTNPNNPEEQEIAIMNYKGNNKLMDGFYKDAFKQTVNRAMDQNESARDLYADAAYTTAGGIFANTPVKQADAKDETGITIGSKLANMTPKSKVGDSESYPTVTTSFGNTDITIVTAKQDNGYFCSKVYKGTNTTGDAWISIDDAASKTAVLQVLGAFKLRSTATDKQTYDNITNLFNLSKYGN